MSKKTTLKDSKIVSAPQLTMMEASVWLKNLVSKHGKFLQRGHIPDKVFDALVYYGLIKPLKGKDDL